jgi:methionyl aminopeptidase
MIPIKTDREIEIMREGGRILAEIVAQVKEEVVPGKTTQELNRLAEGLLFKYGKPSFKNYDGFPASICTSINQEIVHGLPSARVLKQGDILSLDVGLFRKGFHTDMAVTLSVGKTSPEAKKLIAVAEESLRKAFLEIKENVSFSVIGQAVEKYVESQNFVVINNFCGHGIGRKLHEEPMIYNFRNDGQTKIKKGMVFCVEPIIGNGSSQSIKDGFAYSTEDGSLSAHHEHTIALTSNGPELLTIRRDKVKMV